MVVLKKKSWFILIFCFCCAISIAQNSSQKDNHPNEKIYLHFDKPYYSSGEDIWFSAYLLSAVSLQPNTLSKLIYVDIISPQQNVLETKNIQINDDGLGSGSFKLPLSYTTGEYTIRAYTNFMRNFEADYFFTKKVLIFSTNSKNIDFNSLESSVKTNNTSKPDVQFFPEGGNLVTNLINRIGFKAIDHKGNSISITGKIKDSNGATIVNMSTVKFGLGVFVLIPRINETYIAEIDYNGQIFTYVLPKGIKSGVVMQVKELDEFFKASFESSLENGMKNLEFRVTQNGILKSSQIISSANPKAIVNVPKSILNDGVAQFTLINSQKEITNERLVFVQKNDSSNITIETKKKSYGRRELVDLIISTKDKTWDKANFSVAVTDYDIVEPNPSDINIKSYLLLSSEIMGHIEQPNYYFQSPSPRKKRLLDLLMMTQGWRKYKWSVDEFVNPKSLSFPPELGKHFRGKIKSIHNYSKNVNAKVSLFYKNRFDIGQVESKTFNNGSFDFGPFDFPDTTSVIIQATNTFTKKGEKKETITRDFHIELEPFKTPSTNGITQNSNWINNEVFHRYFSRSQDIQHIDSAYAIANGFIILDEVELNPVKAKRIKSKFSNRQIIYSRPSYRVDFDKIPILPSENILSALEGRIPGGLTRGVNTYYGNKEPLYLVDGIPVGDISGITAIPIINISFVDVVKGPAAAIYGSRAANGVVAVYTKRADEVVQTENLIPKEKKGILNILYPGNHQVKEFYQPKYDTKKPEHNKLDYRSTISWSPIVKLDTTKKARIQFYTADIPTIYRIDIQGITSLGQPIVKQLFINVE